MRNLKRLVRFAAATLLATAAEAAGVSGANACVTVSSRTPGIDRIVPDGLELHATTRNVPPFFLARFDFKANAPQQLVEPIPSSITLGPGDTATYRTSNPENIEEEVSGSITVFKVDVRIGLMGERLEEKVGAFIRHSPRSHAGERVGLLRPVKILCIPSNRPGNEKIDLDFPDGDLLVKHGKTFEKAGHSYKASEIGGVRFFLQGLALSSSRRDHSITATHSVNGCSDTAKYTVVGAGDPDYDHDERGHEDIGDDDGRGEAGGRGDGRDGIGEADDGRGEAGGHGDGRDGKGGRRRHGHGGGGKDNGGKRFPGRVRTRD